MKVHAAVSPPPSLGGVILRGEFAISRMLGCELKYSFGGRRGARFPSESFNNLDSCLSPKAPLDEHRATRQSQA